MGQTRLLKPKSAVFAHDFIERSMDVGSVRDLVTDSKFIADTHQDR